MVGVGALGQPRRARSGRCARGAPRPRSTVRGPPSSARPRQRAEALLALAHRVARVRALPSMPIRMSLNSRTVVSPSVASSARSGSVGRRRPACRRRAVVEHRLADQLDLAPRPGRIRPCARAGGRRRSRSAGACGAVASLVVVPVADRQRVAHDEPARRRHPCRLDHVRARHVAPAGRDVDAVGRRRGTRRRRDRAARRNARRSRSAAGTATRPSRRARPAPRCGSPTGTRSRRSAGTASRSSCAGRDRQVRSRVRRRRRAAPCRFARGRPATAFEGQRAWRAETIAARG